MAGGLHSFWLVGCTGILSLPSESPKTLLSLKYLCSPPAICAGVCRRVQTGVAQVVFSSADLFISSLRSRKKRMEGESAPPFRLRPRFCSFGYIVGKALRRSTDKKKPRSARPSLEVQWGPASGPALPLAPSPLVLGELRPGRAEVRKASLQDHAAFPRPR